MLPGPGTARHRRRTTTGNRPSRRGRSPAPPQPPDAMTLGDLLLPRPWADDRVRTRGHTVPWPVWAVMLLLAGVLGLTLVRRVAGDVPLPSELYLATVICAAALGGARIGCLSAGLTLIAVVIASPAQPDPRAPRSAGAVIVCGRPGGGAGPNANAAAACAAP